MGSKRFTPERGKEYTLLGGGTYRCISGGGIHGNNNAVLQNTESKQTFIALGCLLHEDGTIEWFHSISERYASTEAEALEVHIGAYIAALSGAGSTAKKRIFHLAAVDLDIDEAAQRRLKNLAYAPT